MKCFFCPNCKTRQRFSRIFTLKNDSSFNCQHCNTNIKPKKMNNLGFYSVFLATIVPYHILEFNIKIKIMISLILAFIVYFSIICYYYFTIKFEEN